MEHASADAAPRVDRGLLRSWLLLHGSLALLAVLAVHLAGRAFARGAGDIGEPRLRAELAEAHADVVLLGNSMLADGVNADLLDELLTGTDSPGAARRPAPVTFKHALGGVYTAYWSLYLKNCVIPAGAPKLLVIPFRDPILTFATFRTEGPYAENIARVSLPEEPAYAQVIARNTAGHVDPGDRLLEAVRRVSPAYAARDRVRDGLFDVLKALPAEATHGALPSYASAVSAVLPVRAFAAAEDGGRAPGALDTGSTGSGPDMGVPVSGTTNSATNGATGGAPTEATTGGPPAGGAESVEQGADAGNPFGALDGTPGSSVYSTLDYLRFDRVVDASFLPGIVEQCRAHGIRLALLRLHKGPPDWSDMVPAEALAAYERDCNAWLAAHDVILLDTTADAAFSLDRFRGADHLNEAGREQLTIRLAQWLALWWAAPAAPSAELSRAFLQAQAAPPGAAVVGHVREWPVPAAAIEPVRRAMQRVALPEELAIDGDTEADPERSRWQLLEDGRTLGPSHTAQPTIVKFGGGRYAHLGGELFFSASDTTLPRDNGRAYVLRKRVLALRESGASPDGR